MPHISIFIRDLNPKFGILIDDLVKKTRTKILPYATLHTIFYPNTNLKFFTLILPPLIIKPNKPII